MHDRPATLLDARRYPTPPGTGTLGMWLFLAALGMLFAASIIGFLAIRFTARDAPPTGSVHLPPMLWASTAVMLLSSFTIHRALQNVRQERQTPFRNAMLVTCLLALAFLLVQVPAMTMLLRDHAPKLSQYLEAVEAARQAATLEGGLLPIDIRGSGTPMPLEGLVFLMIILHAAHVLGGVIPLGLITRSAHSGRYDHEHHAPVLHLAMYWHFLDGVWVILFAMLLLAA